MLTLRFVILIVAVPTFLSPGKWYFCDAFGPSSAVINPKVVQARKQIADRLLQDDQRADQNSRIELNDSELGSYISNLLSICLQEEESNQNANSGAFASNNFRSFEPVQVAGTWRVVHAPHLWFLAKFALAKFRPIEYCLTADGTMASYVRYQSFVGDYQGWLCTSGTYRLDEENNGDLNNQQPPLVRIVWDKCWWNIGNTERPTVPEKGDFATWIQELGMIGFIEPLSFFPILYVDDKLVVFSFFGLQITAAKILDLEATDEGR